VTVSEKILAVEVSPESTTVTAGGMVRFVATVTTTCSRRQRAQTEVSGRAPPAYE
jgi:hypothetical protein